MSGMIKLREIAGAGREPNMQLIGAFFGALFVARLVPFLISGSFTWMRIFPLLSILAMVGAIVGTLFRTKSETTSFGFAAMAGGIYAVTIAILYVVIREWSIPDVMWGLPTNFVWMCVFLLVLLAVLGQKIAPLWILVVVGYVVASLSASLSAQITRSIVEEVPLRLVGSLMYWLKHGLWKSALAGGALAGIMFAVHKAKKSPLGKF